MCDADQIRVAEREFAKALRNENALLKRRLAEREARDAEYFADIEVRKGKVIFGEKESAASDTPISEAAEI